MMLNYLRGLTAVSAILTSANAYLYHPFASQAPFSSSALSVSTHPSDPAGNPNLATRLEVTSNSSSPLSCLLPGDKFHSGYAHFTSNAGIEDKHMFWWLFEARHDAENAPVILTFGGGPGASGLLFPFSGAGPCIIKNKGDGKGYAVPSPYSWTEHANLIAIDHPVGVGFSYGEPLRNSSETAAWDVDDFLQVFWRKFPHLVKNQFMINSGSYGGTFGPHVANAIYERNIASKSNLALTSRIRNSRIIKALDTMMLVNVWSDSLTHYRWFHESNCNPDLTTGNMFFNKTTCHEIVAAIPGCLDAIQYAYEQPSVGNKMAALQGCGDVAKWTPEVERFPYDYRVKCPQGGCIIVDFPYIEDYLNGEEVRKAIGVPSHLKFRIIEEKNITIPFVLNGDFIQPVYRLLGPSIDDGMRLLIYNGMYDGVAPWRSSFSWMKLLKTKHQAEFRAAPEVEYPGVGTIQQAGKGAGSYTFLKVRDAGHMVIQSQPDLLLHIVGKWLKNEPFFG